MNLYITIMIALFVASLIGTPILEKALKRSDESKFRESYLNNQKDTDARNVLLGCQIQCNGVFEGDYQTKEEARTWLESRNLL